MDFNRVDSLVQLLLQNALAPSTQRSYESAQGRYLDFCMKYNVSALPVSQHILCKFAAVLAAQGLSVSSIKAYLSAVRHMQITLGGSDVDIGNMSTLRYVLQGIKRFQASSRSITSRSRLPITADIMRLLKRAWEQQGPSFDRSMLWAVSCTCFFGFLRSGEATVQTQTAYDPSIHLSISDVSIDSQVNPQTIVIGIKASKTDPFRQGASVYLGRTDSDLCPVAALLSYISARGLRSGPLFIFQDGTPLTRQALVREIRSALSTVGVDPAPYSGHSFRIGAATTAAAKGVEDAVIKTLGRWQSAAYQQYVQLPRSSLAAIARRLAQ